MGKGFYTYANENNGDFPIAAPNSTQLAAPAGVTYVSRTGVDTPGRGAYTVGGACNESGNPINTGACPPVSAGLAYSAALSTTRNLWALVRLGASAPKSFICPSSDDQPNNEDNPQSYWDFGPGDSSLAGGGNGGPPNLLGAWSQCSYGYQVPYGPGGTGKPTTDRDMRMALAADKGPWSTKIEANKGQDPWTTGTPLFSAVNTTSGPDDWRRFNSPNHGGVSDGEGQVVLFADSHAEFQTKPTAGIRQDNIYTQAPNADPTTDQAARGVPPGTSGGISPSTPAAAGTSWTPASNNDSLLWP
jgi:hypothetical protein